MTVYMYDMNACIPMYIYLCKYATGHTGQLENNLQVPVLIFQFQERVTFLFTMPGFLAPELHGVFSVSLSHSDRATLELLMTELLIRAIVLRLQSQVIKLVWQTFSAIGSTLQSVAYNIGIHTYSMLNLDH